MAEADQPSQADNGRPVPHGIDHVADSVAGKVADLGRDIGEYIKQQRNSAKISLRQLSKLAGVSNPYLSQIERGLKKPSAEILQQIAKGLRISAETLYVRAGILDEGHGASDVTAAVLTDPTIGERHKRVLLDVYESFRAEHVADVLPAKKQPAKKTAAKKPAAKKRPATTKTTKSTTKRSS
jgi:transcriptional regulator with XRE-family HTH domain